LAPVESLPAPDDEQLRPARASAVGRHRIEAEQSSPTRRAPIAVAPRRRLIIGSSRERFFGSSAIGEWQWVASDFLVLFVAFPGDEHASSALAEANRAGDRPFADPPRRADGDGSQ